jgi:hypothetical protein
LKANQNDGCRRKNRKDRGIAVLSDVSEMMSMAIKRGKRTDFAKINGTEYFAVNTFLDRGRSRISAHSEGTRTERIQTREMDLNIKVITASGYFSWEFTYHS